MANVQMYRWNGVSWETMNPVPANHDHISLKSNTDNRSAATTPNDYNSLFKIAGLKSNSVLGISNHGSYSGVLGIRGWSDNSGGNAFEFAFAADGTILYRHGATTSWNAWNTFYHTGNKPSKADVSLGSVANYGIATKAEAEAGISNAKYMTPLRTKEAIQKFAPQLRVEGTTLYIDNI